MPQTRSKVKPLSRPAAPQIRTFPTGSTLLDLQNGGGWPLARMVNIVGDASTGKTLIAIEAAANFARLFGAENVRYCETEAAFDPSYAAKLGLPDGIQRQDDVHTVEEFYDDLAAFLKELKGPAGLYCLDSVDALSSLAESQRPIGDKSTYSTEKPKVLSELFRRQMADIARKNVCLLLVSQTRDNIGSTFVPKTRSGGRALDFYATTIVWLHEAGKEKRIVSGLERVVGIQVRAQNKKLKIGEPFRVVDFLLVFGYGIDDELSMIHWLKRNRASEDGLSFPIDRYAGAVRKARDQRDVEKLNQYAGELRAATRARWVEIEEALEPRTRKYELAG